MKITAYESWMKPDLNILPRGEHAQDEYFRQLAALEEDIGSVIAGGEPEWYTPGQLTESEDKFLQDFAEESISFYADF